MIQQKEHFHGSDLEKIEKIYGIKKEDIISFSANVNPLGLSGKLRQTLASHLDVITSYPDREYTRLRATIADYCHTVKEHILTGNGSTELISLVIKTIKPQKALILAPTYSEYEHEVTLCGGQAEYFPLKEEDNFVLDCDALLAALTSSVSMLILCNPNNPTSSAISRKNLKRIMDRCQERKIFVMIDETYIEFAEDYEEINAIPLTDQYENLIILRGISKFFAAPGLRLGYAVTGNINLIQTISEGQNPWSINSLAEVAGELMFTDTTYIKATKDLINQERTRICAVLDTLPGLCYYPPSANFILVKLKKEGITSSFLFDQAIRQNMMIRDCSTFHSLDNHFIRFCIMKPEDNSRLLSLFKEYL